MKYAMWILGAVFLIFAASCNVLNPTANQVQIEASNQYGDTCPVIVNLDGNNTVTITNAGVEQFPLVSPGSHTLNFSTNGTCSSNNCMFDNNGSANYSVTFNTSAGTIYVGTVKTDSTTNACKMTETGP
jgi:type 1 fimbria pilin